MKAYPDTSFLYGFYLKNSNSTAAAACASGMKEPLQLTELLRCEFLQSLRFQVWRHHHRQSEGILQTDADAASKQLDADLVSGVAVLTDCDLRAVLQKASDLSRDH